MSNSKFQINTHTPWSRTVTHFHNPPLSVTYTLNSQSLTALILNHPLKMTWWKRYVTQSWSENFHDIQSYFCSLFFSLCTWRCGSVIYGKRNKLRVLHFLCYWLPTWVTYSTYSCSSSIPHITFAGLFQSVLFCFVLAWSGLVWSGLVWSVLIWSALSGLPWSGLFWSVQVCSVLFSSGLVCSVLSSFPVLVWFGLFCSGMVWTFFSCRVLFSCHLLFSSRSKPMRPPSKKIKR